MVCPSRWTESELIAVETFFSLYVAGKLKWMTRFPDANPTFGKWINRRYKSSDKSLLYYYPQMKREINKKPYTFIRMQVGGRRMREANQSIKANVFWNLMSTSLPSWKPACTWSLLYAHVQHNPKINKNSRAKILDQQCRDIAIWWEVSRATRAECYLNCHKDTRIKLKHENAIIVSCAAQIKLSHFTRLTLIYDSWFTTLEMSNRHELDFDRWPTH
jgi:hypothetical protein